MAKGAQAKQIVMDKLTEMFPNAFMDGKVLRISLVEDGEPIQIKVQLTAAKDYIDGGGDPVETTTQVEPAPAADVPWDSNSIEPTQEEKDNVAKLMASLNL